MKKSVIFLSLLLSETLFAGGIAFQVFPSSSGAIIGEKFPVKIKVFHPPALSVRKLIPPVKDDVAVRNIKYKKGATEDEIDFDAFFYTLGPAETGNFLVSIGTKTAKISSFKVNVKGKLSPKDLVLEKIRPQGPSPFPWLYLFLAVLILAGVFIFLRLRRRKSKEIPERQIPPEEWYLSALSKVNVEKSADIVADEVSDIFRIFLEKKWDIPAIFLSSEELLNEVKKRKINVEARMKVNAFLRNCDLAKFAKKETAATELKKLIKNAEDFVSVNFGEADS